MDRAHGQKHNHVKRATQKMHFNGRARVRFHFSFVPVNNLFYSEHLKDVETLRVRKITTL
jgi:hypothetical protein